MKLSFCDSGEDNTKKNERNKKRREKKTYDFKIVKKMISLTSLYNAVLLHDCLN